jgi:hypothetical protein
MRKVVVPVSILAVALGVWLASRQPAFHGASPESIVTAPLVTPSSEGRRVVQAEPAEAIAAPAGRIDTGNSRTEQRAASEPAPATSPAIVLEMVDQRGLKVLPIFRENESAFVLEPIDPLWSRSREAEILGQVAQVSGLRLLTIEVECRTSTCRLQLTESAASTDSVWRGVPSPAYTELLAQLGYEPRHPISFARDPAARTVTSLTYLPRLQAQ